MHPSSRAIVVAIALVIAGLPLGALADTAPGRLDDLVVVVHPRAATVQGGAVLVAATANTYLFDVALHHADGSAYLITRSYADIHTIDPATMGTDTLVWTTDVQTGAPTSTFTLAVPASALAWGAALPSDGISLTILPKWDENGEHLEGIGSDGEWHLPAGSLNLAANALAAQGRWAEADQADEIPTPVFLLGAQPAGLVQAGNPLLNPGFELGAVRGDSFDDVDSGDLPPECLCRIKTATPPWFLFAAGDAADTIPFSYHHQEVGLGTSGAALGIHYDTRDDGRNVVVGQLLSFPPGSDSVWTGTSDVRVSFDVKVRDDSGFATPWHAATTIHWLDGTERQLTRAPPAQIPADNTWRRVTLEYGAAADGKALTSVFLSLNLDIDDAALLTVHLDNIVLSGAVLGPGLSPRSDVTDGYAMQVEPLGVSGPSNVLAQQGLVSTPSGNYYLYELTAHDYTGITPRVLPVASYDGGAAGAIVQFRDATHAAASNPLSHKVGGFKFVDADKVLVAVPAAARTANAGPESIVGVWGFAPVRETYTNPACAEGSACNQPVPGFYAPAKNALVQYTLADQLDYAVTPVRLTTTVVGTFSFALTLGVPQAASGTFSVPVTSTAPVLEDVEVEFFPASGGVQTSTVTVGRGIPASAVFPGSFGARGDVVKTQGSTFATGDRIEAGGPVAAFTVSGLCAPILDTVPCMPVSFADGSADLSLDPGSGIVRREWRFGDGATQVVTGASSGTSHTYMEPGTYAVELIVTDSVGLSDTATDLVTVANAPPVSSFELRGPGVAGTSVVAGAPVLLRLVGNPDPSITRSLRFDWTVLDGLDVLLHAGAAGAGFTFPDDGTYTVGLEVTDEHGASAFSSLAVTASNPGPTATLSAVSVVGGGTAGTVLLGESVSVSGVVADAAGDLTVSTYTLEIQGPDDALLPEPATVTAAPQGVGWRAELSLTATPTAVGAHQAILHGMDEDGAQVTVTRAFTVAANTAPVAALVAAPSVAEIGQLVTFDASGSADPDGRGIAEYRFDTDGDDVADVVQASPFLFMAYDAAGPATVSVVVVDASGLASDPASASVEIDDAIAAALELPDADSMGPSGAAMFTDATDALAFLRGTVTLVDDLGQPIGFATGTFAYDYVGVPGSGVSLLGPTTSVVVIDGAGEFHARPFASQDVAFVQATVGFLPGLYTYTLTMEASSRDGAPAGAETSVVTGSFWIGPDLGMA